MNQPAIKRLIEKRRATATRLLTEVEFQDLEPILIALKRCRPIDELSIALLERMAVAPLAEFNALKVLYFRHFASRVQ